MKQEGPRDNGDIGRTAAHPVIMLDVFVTLYCTAGVVQGLQICRQSRQMLSRPSQSLQSSREGRHQVRGSV